MADNFPLPVYNFVVSINGTEIGFQEVQGLGADIEYEEIREVGTSDHTNRTFKKIQYKNLILKKGVFKNGMTQMEEVASLFYNNASRRGERRVTVEPVPIEIVLKNEDDNPVITWELGNCVPVKYEFGALNAMESDILVETMEFQYHSMATRIS